MIYGKIGDWYEFDEGIRYREVGYYAFDGNWEEEYQFEINKRPYFWGLIGRKKWMSSITTNDYYLGFAFSKELLQ